ncbi:antitoxin MazE-like protein [Sphingomonas glacialis]|nr:antitoxin MazE-like protein [Sphingomonas glacialis]
MTSAERVAKRRAALRAQGLRPKTFWLPDTTTPAFQEEARKTREWLWARVEDDREAMAFAGAMTDVVLERLDRETER